MSTPFDTIDAINRRYEQLFNSGKIDELVTLYTKEATIIRSDQEKYQGHQYIKAFLQGARDFGVDNLRITTGTVVEDGQDKLIEKSSYENSLDRANYQVTWKRVAPGKNEWQIETDISI
jgi:ketosteroid isomerase-like protein